jgi:BMFP domain-containing protein YqiC
MEDCDMDARWIDDFTRRLSAAMPASFDVLREDAQRNLKEVVKQALAGMDLVTREEFDVQVALLKRAEARMQKLEQQLAAAQSESTAS